MRYEYKVVPAPAKPRKGPRIKGAEAKFAYSLETVMNEYAADGWEYQRADILPSEERRGFRATQTVYRTVLVFRRALGAAQPMAEPAELRAVPDVEPAVDYAAPSTAPATAPAPEPDAEHVSEPERRARFSLVGPARRGDDTGAPPLAAPHVGDPSPSDADPSEERR